MTTEWHSRPATDLETTIAEFKSALPGWWYSVCECQVSSDASCAPTVESSHHKLITLDARFDSGFHADLAQPATLAQALRDVMGQAQAAIAHNEEKGRFLLTKAKRELTLARSAMDSSTFHGRSRTDEARAEVERLRAALGLDA